MTNNHIDLTQPLDFPPTIGRPARGALHHAGIRSLQQLAGWTERDVASLHGMGPKGIRLLKAAMAEHGLAFRDPEAS